MHTKVEIIWMELSSLFKVDNDKIIFYDQFNLVDILIILLNKKKKNDKFKIENDHEMSYLIDTDRKCRGAIKS